MLSQSAAAPRGKLKCESVARVSSGSKRLNRPFSPRAGVTATPHWSAHTLRRTHKAASLTQPAGAPALLIRPWCMLGLVSENERRPGPTAAESHPLCIHSHKTPSGGGSGRSRRNVIGLTKGGKSGIIIITIKKLQLVQLWHFAGEPTSSEAANHWQQRQNRVLLRSPLTSSFSANPSVADAHTPPHTHINRLPSIVSNHAGESFLLHDWLEWPTEGHTGSSGQIIFR